MSTSLIKNLHYACKDFSGWYLGPKLCRTECTPEGGTGEGNWGGEFGFGFGSWAKGGGGGSGHQLGGGGGSGSGSDAGSGPEFGREFRFGVWFRVWVPSSVQSSGSSVLGSGRRRVQS